MKYSYDTDAIMSKIKQYATFLAISLLILMSSLTMKFVIMKSYTNELSKQIPESELGKINNQIIYENNVSFKEKYEQGFMYGNLQNNLEQGNSRISNLVNGKSQLAHNKNITFRSRFNHEKKKYTLSIVDEEKNEELFSYNLENKAKSLITLENYHFFIEENPNGDIMHVIDDYKSVKNITPFDTSDRVRFNSVVTDSKNLYFSDGLKIYSSSLYGQNVKVLVNASSNTRIINLKDGFLFTDDGYTTSKISLETLKTEVINSHLLAQSVIFHEDNLLYAMHDGSLIDFDIQSKNAVSYERSSFFNSVTMLNDDLIYFDNEKGFIETNNEKIYLSNKNKPIVSIYVTNNYIYLYDMQGFEEIIKINKY